jgi:multidrug efflux pump subunit AcrA (membrane-fusion protein)
MNKIFKLTVFLLLAGITFSACGKKRDNIKDTEKKVPLVKVTTIKTQPFTESYKFIGVLKPYETAKLSSE